MGQGEDEKSQTKEVLAPLGRVPFRRTRELWPIGVPGLVIYFDRSESFYSIKTPGKPVGRSSIPAARRVRNVYMKTCRIPADPRRHGPGKSVFRPLRRRAEHDGESLFPFSGSRQDFVSTIYRHAGTRQSRMVVERMKLI